MQVKKKNSTVVFFCIACAVASCAGCAHNAAPASNGGAPVVDPNSAAAKANFPGPGGYPPGTQPKGNTPPQSPASTGAQ